MNSRSTCLLQRMHCGRRGLYCLRDSRPPRTGKASATSNGSTTRLAFLGENTGEVAQVYAFNIRTGTLTKRTSHSTPITAFNVTGDGRRLAFVAERTQAPFVSDEEVQRNGMIITTQSLADILSGGPSEYTVGDQLFVQSDNQLPREVVLDDPLVGDVPSLSPDGRFVCVQVWMNEVPAAWSEYSNEQIRPYLRMTRMAPAHLPLRRLMLFDRASGALRPLLDAPLEYASPGRLRWAKNSRSVIIQRTFLPLTVSDREDLETRKADVFDVEITLPTMDYQKVMTVNVPEEKASVGIHIDLEENVSTPPKIFASDDRNSGKILLWDLNPQFSELKFGTVEIVHWKMPDGKDAAGGLYLPPDYQSGIRYPLVIQTHGFNPNRFSIDGLNEWSSAFAARALSARGIMVLQSSGFSPFNNQTEEGPREMARLEAAIEYLDRRGLVNRDHVGVTGFSRSVYDVGYALTHSRYKFAAAYLADGIDGSYFSYVASGSSASDDVLLNGGAPFGEGLQLWLKRAPAFNLDRISTPLRLAAHGREGSVLGLWEWFLGLTYLGKPVEFIEFPYGSHLLVKPWERRAAQQGLVDWFCFWLKDEQDSDPAKHDQYVRWDQLKAKQSHRAE